MDAYNHHQLLDEISPDCRRCIVECKNNSPCNVADECLETVTDGMVVKLSSSIWSTSANSNYYTQDASLSQWGTKVTPTFGPPYATNTPNGY